MTPVFFSLLMMSAAIPEAETVRTVTSGRTAVVDLSSGEGWLRVLESGYVRLEVASSEPVGMTAYGADGRVLCRSEGEGPLTLSAFRDYWFFVRLEPIPGSSPEEVRVRVNELPHSSIWTGERAGGAVPVNSMADSYVFTSDRSGRWTFRLEETGGAHLDLEAFGPDMRLWGRSASPEGIETVTVSVLDGETVTVLVSRSGKAGTGGYLLSVEPSGQFPSLASRFVRASIGGGEVHRYMLAGDWPEGFLDLAILAPGKDLDLLLKDMSGGLVMASRSYLPRETLLVPPAALPAVAEVVPFDLGDGDRVFYELYRREPGRVHTAGHLKETLPAGTRECRPAGFAPPEGGLYRVEVAFEKTRDGDVSVYRGPGGPAVTFASLRGVEEFLLHVDAGDTVWLDPYYAVPDLAGEARVSISRADAPPLDGPVRGTITETSPSALFVARAEGGTILDIRLSGDDREVDLDMFVSGPGLDLTAEGWVSSVDAAGDEAVAAYAPEDCDFGVTVYLYERRGSTSFGLEAGVIENVPLSDPSPEPGIWAVVAGISGYPSQEDVLNRASLDAVEVYEFLTEEQGVPPGRIVLLVDAMATVEAFTSGVVSVLDRAGPEDRAVIFFSGHGDQSAPGTGGPEEADASDEYLCLYDGAMSDDRLASLVDSLAEAPVFIFVDACHSGGFVNDFSEGDNVMLLTAAREDLTVSERILTPILLEGSRGDADADGNGYVSALELLEYVEKRLQLICPECDTGLQEGMYVCPACGAVLRGDQAVPRPEQGMFLDEDMPLWRVVDN